MTAHGVLHHQLRSARPSPKLNHWTSPKCAKAFWSQSDLPVFQRLVADTVDWAAPQADEEWLDLGCGGGTLSKALWQSCDGTVKSVVGVDASAANATRYAVADRELAAGANRFRFQTLDFSHGLACFPDSSFDHAISGLSISYAESFEEATGRWTQAAYDRLLGEIRRVIRPGGRFVFSVNVPSPSWWTVGVRSLWGGIRRAKKPLRFLKNSWRMLRYGAWLKAEARTGRFHYLPADVIASKLFTAGFSSVEHRTSYAGQAFVFRAVKGG